jgi:ankyrin repeat protein
MSIVFFDQGGQTPLSHACAEGLTDVVAELVQRHAYVNTVDKVALTFALF